MRSLMRMRSQMAYRTWGHAQRRMKRSIAEMIRMSRLTCQIIGPIQPHQDCAT
jgi:hypothetical protein